MKKKILTVLGVTMILCCMTACGSKKAEQADTPNQPTENVEAVENTEAEEPAEVAENSAKTEIKTYEFETFDGETVVINEGNIVSQEICEEPLEWDGLPADATQLAPGRDFILFADSTNYYVEDAADKLVTIAFKELGDVIEETDYAIFDNNVFTFSYDPKYFVVVEDGEYVTVSFYNEETQTAGSNTITFTGSKKADAMEVAKEYAKQYGVDEGSVYETNMGASGAKSYSFNVSPTDEAESGNQTRAMACAVENGDNVIVIEVLSHVEPDEGMDMFISDKIAEVLDTFSIN